MRRILLILLVLPVFIQAQSELTPARVDELSYKYIIEKKYADMKLLGKMAFKDGINFFFLQLRMGIAYYETKNYEEAVTYFQKARTMNPNDALAQEYLYYSYLFSARKVEAYSLASTLSAGMQKKVGYQKKFIESVGLNSWMSLTSNPNYKSSSSIIGSNQRADAVYNGNVSIGNLIIESRIKNRLQLDAIIGFANVQSKAFGQAKTRFNDQTDSVNFSLNNLQLNLFANYTFKSNWKLGIGVGYYMNSYPVATFHQGQPFTPPQPPNPPHYSFSSSSQNAIAAIISIGKRFKYVEPSVTGSISNLNGVKQYQAQGKLIVYPLGGYGFSITNSFAYINNDGNNQTVIAHQIDKRIAKNFWINAYAGYGNFANYISAKGLYTFNTSDPISLNAGLNLQFFLKHFEISPGYYFQQRKASINTYSTNGANATISNYNYNNQLLNLNIKWYF